MSAVKLARRVSFVVPAILLSAVLQAAPQTGRYKASPLQVIRYAIDYQIDFSEQSLSASCAIRIVNPSDKSVTEVPMLLYRLLSVDSIKNSSGQSTAYQQAVTTFEDWPAMQQNFIRLTLGNPLVRGDTGQFTVFYSGKLLGYAETGMLYVKDKIDSTFTILRPDCAAYPEIGVPSWSVNRSAGLPTFDYEISVSAPAPLVAANGGQLLDKKESGGLVKYRFRNIKPAWRIDLAIAPYETLVAGANRVYYFPAHKEGAKRIIDAMQESLNLFSSWWGPLPDYQGFTIIEISAGYGSQADVTSILQTESAFVDPEQMYELYHELSHQWNIVSLDSLPCRWEEGLATFVQYLAIEQVEGRAALDESTDRIMAAVSLKLTEREALTRTAMVDFGVEGYTDFSYTLGMLFFRVLYELTGPEEFHRLIGGFLQQHRLTGATTADFARYLETNSNAELSELVSDWILTAGYARILKESHSFTELVASYR